VFRSPPAKEVLRFPGSTERELPKLPAEKDGPLGTKVSRTRETLGSCLRCICRVSARKIDVSW
jgi:hypothetical protein